MSQARIDELFRIIAALCIKFGQDDSDDNMFFANHEALYEAIDVITVGDAPWMSFTVRYNGDRPETSVPRWIDQEFDVWTRDPLTVVHNFLKNQDFNGEWDYVPYRDFVQVSGSIHRERKYKDFMSTNWAWKQCVCSCHTSKYDFIDIMFSYRTSLCKTPILMAQCLCQSS